MASEDDQDNEDGAVPCHNPAEPGFSASRLDAIRAFYKHRPRGDAWYLVEIVDELLTALKQVEAEMRAGLGSSYGETREQVRRAIVKAEGA